MGVVGFPPKHPLVRETIECMRRNRYKKQGNVHRLERYNLCDCLVTYGDDSSKNSEINDTTVDSLENL